MPAGYQAQRIWADLSQEFASLEVSSADPTRPTLVFQGGSGGLEPNRELVALLDGRTLSGVGPVLAGGDATTPGQAKLDIYISEPVGDAAGDPFIVELFDFGMRGAMNHTPDDESISTCFQLYTSSAPGVMNETLVKSVVESEINPDLNELTWLRLFDTGNGDSHHEGAKDENGVHWYHASVKLSAGCAGPPSASHGGFNALKIRTNGESWMGEGCRDECSAWAVSRWTLRAMLATSSGVVNWSSGNVLQSLESCSWRGSSKNSVSTKVCVRSVLRWTRPI